MATTWSATRDSIRGDLWRTSSGIPDDVCNRAIHQTLLAIENERAWLWLENITTIIPVTLPTKIVDLPADCSAIASLSYQRQGLTSFELLDRVNLTAVRFEASHSSIGGWPSMYAFSQGKAYLDREALADSSFELIYTGRTPENMDAAMVAPDTNRTLQKERAAVIAGAAAHIAITYLRNTAEHGRQRTAYEAMIERMHDTENNARSDNFGPSIMPDTAYQDAANGRF